jgi:solute:Na+ symporter, SSS family
MRSTTFGRASWVDFSLALSYFGTDQSQVGRYISGKSVAQIRLGLLFNGALKIPMQFSILLIGILLLAFYQFQQAPLIFNKVVEDKAMQSSYKEDYQILQDQLAKIHEEKSEMAYSLLQTNSETGTVPEALTAQFRKLQSKTDSLRTEAKALIF